MVTGEPFVTDTEDNEAPREGNAGIALKEVWHLESNARAFCPGQTADLRSHIEDQRPWSATSLREKRQDGLQQPLVVSPLWPHSTSYGGNVDINYIYFLAPVRRIQPELLRLDLWKHPGKGSKTRSWYSWD